MSVELVHVPTLLGWAEQMRASGLAPATVAVRQRVVAAVARAAGVEPAQLDAGHVLSYLGGHDLAPWSRRKYGEHLRAWATWAGLPDPTVGVSAPRQPRGVPRPVSEDQLVVLLDTAAQLGGRDVRAWVLLGAFCGLRSAESAAVRGADLVVGSIGPVLRVKGKGGRVDVVPCPPIVERALVALRAERGAGRLWPGADPGTVQRAIKQLGRLAGVPMTSHQLRHRYGTALYAASRDLLIVQRLMRHASPVTTAGYARVADADATRLALQLPGAGGSLERGVDVVGLDGWRARGPDQHGAEGADDGAELAAEQGEHGLVDVGVSHSDERESG